MKRDLFTAAQQAPVTREELGASPAPAKPPAAAAPSSASRARALGTCGTCAHGEVSRFGMIACALIASKASVHSPSLACMIDRWVQLEPARAAKRAAQAGIDQAVGAADRAAPGWSDAALAWIGRYAAKMQGRRLTGYDLVQQSVGEQVPQPPNPKAWGGPIQRAARAGHLVKVGTVPDPNPERHGSDVPLWECRA